MCYHDHMYDPPHPHTPHTHTLTYSHSHTHTHTPARTATSVVVSSRVGVALPTVLGHHRYGSTVPGSMGSPITVPQVSPATVAWKYWKERNQRRKIR